MESKNAAPAEAKLRQETTKLDRRYGKIGILAVAAALPYQSNCKNPAYAPAELQPEKWLAEIAA
jgi:hypothetical protein